MTSYWFLCLKAYELLCVFYYISENCHLKKFKAILIDKDCSKLNQIEEILFEFTPQRGQFLSRVKLVWIQRFLSLRLVAWQRLKNLIKLQLGWINKWIHVFFKAIIVKWNANTYRHQIGTWVSDSISYDNNRCAKRLFILRNLLKFCNRTKQNEI